MEGPTRVMYPAGKGEKLSYRHNGNTHDVHIVQDDCIRFLQQLAENSVDLVITDPAYSGMNNQLQLGRGRIVGKYKDRGTVDSKWFAEFEDSEDNYKRFLNECQRVLKKDTGHLYLMFDSFSLLSLGHLVREFFDVKNIIAWDKVNMGMGHYFRRRHEFILFATNGNNRKLRHRSFPDIWRFKRIHRARYPTQKPVELFQAMVYASGNEGAIVCDPFVGSGSSAIAAIKNNCHFIGCDTSMKAVETSVARIDHYIEYRYDPLQPSPANIPGEKIFWEASSK